MKANTRISMAFLFFIVAVALSTVVFPDDRMVVKITMFAAGMAFGSTLVVLITQRQHTSSA